MMGIQGFHNMFFVEQHAHMNIILSPPNVSSAPISKKNSHLKSMKYKSLKPSLQKLTAGMEATNGRLWKMIFPCKMVYVFFRFPALFLLWKSYASPHFALRVWFTRKVVKDVLKNLG